MTDPHAAALLRLADLPPDVAARLRRSLQDGTFGACAACGDDIAAEALMARPEVALCAACADDLRERQQGRRLGVCGPPPGR